MMRHPLFSLLGFQSVSASRLARRRRPGRPAASVEDLEIRQLLAAEVRLVKDIAPGGTNSNPSELTDVGGRLFFTAEQTPGDVELWTSDGTASGTRVVKDILPGPIGASPRELTDVNGVLYFSARSVINQGFELWRSDGTESGTFMVKDIRPGVNGAQLSELTNVNGTLFFSATDGTTGLELWKSDGTAAGTVRVKDIVPGSGGSTPRHLTNIDGTLYFSAFDTINGTEPWKSDGTESGTFMVKNIASGINGSFPGGFTAVNGKVAFVTNFNTLERNSGLWSTNGTDAGTTSLFITSQRVELKNVGGILYFSATPNNSFDFELYRSDGTPAATQRVKDIRPGIGGSQPRALTDYNGTLIFYGFPSEFSADAGIFRSDGTAQGTVQINNLFSSLSIMVHNDLLYFMTTGASPEFFVNLWSSDGTSAPPVLEYEFDFPIGTDGIAVGSVSVGDTLYFLGRSLAGGRELWALNQLRRPTVVQPATLAMTTRPTIAWTSVPGAVNYEVRINDVSRGIDNFVPQQTVLGTSFTPSIDFGLGQFTVQVRADDGTQKSSWSQEYSFRNYLRVTPQAISRLQSTARPTISWNALQGAAKYDFWVDNITTGQSQVIRNTNLTSTSFTPAADLPMGVYRAWVRGMTADGITGYFSTPIDFVVVPAPTVIGPLNSTFSRQPTFSWTAVTGAVAYEIVLRNANNGQIVHNPTITSGTSWPTPADLPVGTYRWQVAAVSSDGYKTQTPQVITFFVGGRTDVLSPTGTTSDRTPTFSWRPVDGASAFRIKVDRIDVPVSGIIDRTSRDAITQYTPITPLPVGTYRVWVRAISSFDDLGLWSLPVNFQVTQSFESRDDILMAILPTDVVLTVLTEERSGFSPTRETTVISDDAGSDQSAEVPVAEGELVTRQSEASQSTSVRRDEDHAARVREGILDRLMAGQGESDDLTWMF